MEDIKSYIENMEYFGIVVEGISMVGPKEAVCDTEIM
jgi:hypothetical protein